MAKISAKQELFVDEYLIDLNATQAAIRAGYSPKTAEQQGSRLLSNVKVKGRVAEKMAERSKRCGINQDRVLQELARIAFVNPADVINMSDASIKDEASFDDLACIQSVKVKTVNGDKVVVSIKKYPEGNMSAEGEIIEVLGKSSDTNVDLISVIRAHDYKLVFPKEVNKA